MDDPVRYPRSPPSRSDKQPPPAINSARHRQPLPTALPCSQEHTHGQQETGTDTPYLPRTGHWLGAALHRLDAFRVPRGGGAAVNSGGGGGRFVNPQDLTQWTLRFFAARTMIAPQTNVRIALSRAATRTLRYLRGAPFLLGQVVATRDQFCGCTVVAHDQHQGVHKLFAAQFLALEALP